MIVGREMKFEAPLVSIRAVDITPDLKNAHVFVSAIGTKWQKEQAITALEANRQHLQHELSRRVILKYTPHLHFQLDDSQRLPGITRGLSGSVWVEAWCRDSRYSALAVPRPLAAP